MKKHSAVTFFVASQALKPPGSHCAPEGQELPRWRFGARIGGAIPCWRVGLVGLTVLDVPYALRLQFAGWTSLCGNIAFEIPG